MRTLEFHGIPLYGLEFIACHGWLFLRVGCEVVVEEFINFVLANELNKGVLSWREESNI